MADYLIACRIHDGSYRSITCDYEGIADNVGQFLLTNFNTYETAMDFVNSPSVVPNEGQHEIVNRHLDTFLEHKNLESLLKLYLKSNEKYLYIFDYEDNEWKAWNTSFTHGVKRRKAIKFLGSLSNFY